MNIIQATDDWIEEMAGHPRRQEYRRSHAGIFEEGYERGYNAARNETAKPPPTPEERAKALAEHLRVHGALAHVSGLEQSFAAEKIAAEIHAAIAADREGR